MGHYMKVTAKNGNDTTPTATVGLGESPKNWH